MPNLLTSRRIPNKLLWISLSFSLPIAVLLYFMVAGINDDITFAERELAGNEYQRPVHEMLRHLARHQILVGGPELEIVSEQGKVDQALQRLEGVQRLYGTSLQVTDTGLAQRQRSGSAPSDIAVAWQKLKSEQGTLTAASNEVRHRQLRDALRQLVTHVGDTSNLILDPDLDTYYLTDATLVGIPRIQNRMTDLRQSVRTAFAKQELDASDLLNLVATARLLREADFKHVVDSLRSALAEDQNFHGINSTIR